MILPQTLVYLLVIQILHELMELIKNGLLEKGKPIPENDIWIAAVAMQHDLTIATRDDHSTKVEKLKCELW